MKRSSILVLLALSTALCGSGTATPQQSTPHHDFDVTARRYEFLPPRLDVHQGDLVKVTLRSTDIPHSFVIDAYRIAKKAAAGSSTTFEFVADQAGEFSFYCNLHNEEGCQHMRGTLVVSGSATGRPAPRILTSGALSALLMQK